VHEIDSGVVGGPREKRAVHYGLFSQGSRETVVRLHKTRTKVGRFAVRSGGLHFRHPFTGKKKEKNTQN